MTQATARAVVVRDISQRGQIDALHNQNEKLRVESKNLHWWADWGPTVALGGSVLGVVVGVLLYTAATR